MSLRTPPDALLVQLLQRLGPAWLARRLDDPDARRYIRFLFVGVLNALFGYLLFAALLYAGVHYAIASAVATVLGVIFNFFTTGRLVFDSRDPRRLVLFGGTYAVLYLVGLGELRVAELLGYNLFLVSALLIVPNSLLGYVINKTIVFRAGR